MRATHIAGWQVICSTARLRIDAAVNVFGVDCGELLLKDDEKQHYSVSELFD
jgi:hypothetical protein